MKNNYIKAIFVLIVLSMLVLLPSCQKHEHIFGEWSTTLEATCVKDGVQSRICECGVEETKTINSTGHSYGEWVTAIEATCTNDGAQIRTCGCGDEEINLISATEHSYGEWGITTAATCVSDGIKTRTCVCGKEETMLIEATGDHSYGDWVITTTATCTKEGVQTRTCGCGKEETMPVAKTNEHSYGEWITTTAATCTNDGIKTRTCICGDKQTMTIKATEHSYGNWMSTTAATCTREGVKVRTCSCGHQESATIKKSAHKWKAATCTHPKTCEKCFATVGDTIDHSLNCEGYCTMCNRKITVDMRTLVGKPSNCSTIKKLGFCFYQNSSGEIKVCWGGENLSGKTITSCSVTIQFYDADGDPVYSKVTGKSEKIVTIKGIVLPNQDIVIFEIVDRVENCHAVVIGDITLEYSDGTSDKGWFGWGTKYRKDGMI